MWMRLIRSHGLEPGKSQRVVDRYRQEDLARIEQAPGFQGIAMGENRRGGSIGSVTFWDDRQAMLETEQLSAQARKRAAPMFYVEDPMLVDHFEITYARELDPITGSPAHPCMRVVRFRGLTSEAADEAAATYRDGAERHLPDVRGCFRIAVGVNHDAGSIVVITFWTSERYMREAGPVGEQVRESAASTAAARLTPLVDQFEVTLASGLDHLSGREAAPPPVLAEAPAPPPPTPVAPPAVPDWEPQIRSIRGMGVFARITRLVGLPSDRVPKTAGDIDQARIPTMEAEPGFVGALILADHIGGESITVTLWENEAAMVASEASARRLREEVQDDLEKGQEAIVLRCELVASRPWTFDRGATPYARLNRHPGLTPEGIAPRIEALEQRQLPAVEDEPGFAGALIFTSVSETQILSLSLWESQDAMRRSEKASRGARESLESGLSQWERAVVSRAEVIASRHWAGDPVTA